MLLLEDEADANNDNDGSSDKFNEMDEDGELISLSLVNEEDLVHCVIWIIWAIKNLKVIMIVNEQHWMVYWSFRKKKVKRDEQDGHISLKLATLICSKIKIRSIELCVKFYIKNPSYN